MDAESLCQQAETGGKDGGSEEEGKVDLGLPFFLDSFKLHSTRLSDAVGVKKTERNTKSMINLVSKQI